MEKATTRQLCVLGLALGAMIIFRRWYAFWVVSYGICAPLDAIVAQFRKKVLTFRSFFNVVVKILFAAIIAALELLFIAPSFFTRAVTTDYEDIYSGYSRHATIFGEYGEVISKIGVLHITLFILSVVLSLWFIPNIRRFLLFVFFQLAICSLLFLRVQSADNQHYYLFLPIISLFIAILLEFVFEKITFKTFFGYFVVSLLLAINFVASFVPAYNTAFNKSIRSILPVRNYPEIPRLDVGIFSRIQYINHLLLDNNKKKLFVLTSLDAFRIQARLFSMEENANFISRISVTKGNDKANGFPNALLTADYVLITDPYVFEKGAAARQNIITIPAKEILTSSSIGNAYEKLNFSLILDKGVKVSYFERKRPFKQEELNELSQKFKDIYPDRPFIYEIHIPNSLIKD